MFTSITGGCFRSLLNWDAGGEERDALTLCDSNSENNLKAQCLCGFRNFS